jgi:aryl-alcohol dehydrogenase-like predicted oxidoreductase
VIPGTDQPRSTTREITLKQARVHAGHRETEETMQQRQRTGEPNRRHMLALAGGLGIARCFAAHGAPAPEVSRDTTRIMTRPIPSTGEQLPIVGLGTAQQWVNDLPATHAAFTEVIRTLADGGGRVIDTASNPGGYGIAESILGEIFTETDLRPRIFIADKIEEQLFLNLGALQAALRQLQVSKIDLIQLHSVTWSWQNFGPLRDWKAQGLVRYIGITKDSSNLNLDTVEAIMRHWKPDFIQVDCSLRNREAEERVLPAAAELGVATLINEPFGGVRRGGSPSGRNLFRAVQGKPLPHWASEFDAATWGQFFLKYLLGNPAVTAVIPGTDKASHMADNLGAGRGRLPNAAQRQRMVQFIEELA